MAGRKKQDAALAVGEPNSAIRRLTIANHVDAFGKPFRDLFAVTYNVPWSTARAGLVATDAKSCLRALHWAAKRLGVVTHKVEHF